MPKIKVDISGLQALASKLNSIKSDVVSASTKVKQTKNNLDWQVGSRQSINTRITNVQNRLTRQQSIMEQYYSAVSSNAVGGFSVADNQIRNQSNALMYSLRLLKALNSSLKSILPSQFKNHINRVRDLFSPRRPLPTSVLLAVLRSGSSYASTARNNIKDVLISKLTGVNSAIKSGAFIVGDKPTVSKIFGKISTVISLANKAPKNNTAGFTASTINYAKSFLDFASGKKTGTEVYTGALGFASASTSMWSAVYNYISKTSAPAVAVGLSETLGQKVAGVNAIGSTLGLIKSITSSITDKDDNILNRVANWIDTGGVAFKTVATTYDFVKYTPLVLKAVDTGGLNVVWKAAGSASQAAKLSPWVSVVSGITTTISTGSRSYGEYSADGAFDVGDASAVMIDASIAGLNSMFLLGLADAETVSDEIKNWAKNWGGNAYEYRTSNSNLNEMYENASDFGKFWLTWYSIFAVGPSDTMAQTQINNAKITSQLMQDGVAVNYSFTDPGYTNAIMMNYYNNQ